MKYTIKPVTDQAVWDSFVISMSPATFLHSWLWGEHSMAMGNTVLRLGIYEQQTLVGVAHFFLIKARRGTYLLCPHGPVLSPAGADEKLVALSDYVDQAAKELRCDFVRICPILMDTEANRQVFKELGFRGAPIHMHPELSWILDITPSEDSLLAAMRKTTRYLIRKGEKEGIEVTVHQDSQALKDFWPVYEATFQRQRFTPFSRRYIEKEFGLYAERGAASLFLAHYQGEVISAAIIIFYGNSGFYHHSGSVPKFASINSSYLLQWRVIQEAKRRGLKFYNFWGISPDSQPRHPWAGLSLFKKGFGGYSEHYVHAQDKPLTYRYYLNYLVETLRRIQRGV